MNIFYIRRVVLIHVRMIATINGTFWGSLGVIWELIQHSGLLAVRIE